MTRQSIQEYVAAIRERYRKASKEEKGKILDEFTQVTGLHRKAAIRLLNREVGSLSKKRGGRSKKYDATVADSLKTVWEAGDRLCSKRLKPFMPEILDVLRHHGELCINAHTEGQLCRMSPATIDRLLKPYRKSGGRRGLTTTRQGSLLKNMIPIRTFTDWQENKPGFLETDLVSPLRGECRWFLSQYALCCRRLERLDGMSAGMGQRPGAGAFRGTQGKATPSFPYARSGLG